MALSAVRSIARPSVRLARSTLELIRLQRICGLARVVLCVGMPRSGSTLVYNIARLCAEARYGDGAGGYWYDDLCSAPSKKCLIVKAHHITRPMRIRAGTMIYSYRDVRDVMVSMLRMFDKQPSVQLCDGLMQLHYRSIRWADVVVKYEQLMENERAAVQTIANRLGISVDVNEVVAQIPQASVGVIDHNYDRVTQMHGSHATGTLRGEWRTILPHDVIDHVHRNYGDWLRSEGYAVD
jgi:hypothetical protein